MDLIITALLENPAVWTYGTPFNLLALAAFLLGMLLQILLLRNSRKWLLLLPAWLVASLCCEFLYRTTVGLEGLAPGLFGLFTYLAFFGSLIGALIAIILKQVRRF